MRKCDISRNKNKLWFKLYTNNELKSFIQKFYIIENHSFEELKNKLECSESKLIRIIKEYNLSKPRNLVSEKIVATRLKNGNGVYETNEILVKKRATYLAKYGVENYMKSDDFKIKRKNTMINRYGAEYTMQSSELKLKVENTNLQKYGYKNAFQDINWQHNIGGNSASWSSSARNLRQLHYEKYGFTKSSWSERTFNILKNREAFIKYLDALPMENRTISFISNDLDVIYDIIRNRYIKWDLYEDYPLQQFRSLPEIELVTYIKTFYIGKILINCRNIIAPYELDIFLPELSIAIEYNGDFWHKNKLNIDIKKQLKCTDKNIYLYTIKEKDYINNNEQILNNLKCLISGGEKCVNKNYRK